MNCEMPEVIRARPGQPGRVSPFYDGKDPPMVVGIVVANNRMGMIGPDTGQIR